MLTQVQEIEVKLLNNIVYMYIVVVASVLLTCKYRHSLNTDPIMLSILLIAIDEYISAAKKKRLAMCLSPNAAKKKKGSLVKKNG